MKIIRHRPAYFTGYDDEVIEINSIEELLNTEWIKSWSTNPDFYRYSVAKDDWDYIKPKQTCIMAEFKNGTEWWVIGICHDEDVDILLNNLPKWEPVYKKNKNDESGSKEDN